MRSKLQTRWIFLALCVPAILLLAAAPAAAQSSYWYRTGGGGSASIASTPGAGGAYLGVQLEEEVEHGEGGARVSHVVDDSPAARAGLREGDIIVGFDSKTVRGPVALTRQIRSAESGDKVALRVIRDKRKQTIEVELGQRASTWSVGTGEGKGLFPHVPGKPGRSFAFSCDGEDDDCSALGGTLSMGSCEDGDCGFGLFLGGGRPVLGVELVEVTDELREHLGGRRDSGVLVSKIVAGTPAERGGLQVGDLIVAVAGDGVKNTRDLRRALQGKRGETFDVEVIRDRRSRSIRVSVPAADDDRPTGPRAYAPLPHPPAPPAPPATVTARAASAAPRAYPSAPPAVSARPARLARPARPAAPPAPAAFPAPSASPAVSIPVPAPPAPRAPLPPAPPAAPSPRAPRMPVVI